MTGKAEGLFYHCNGQQLIIMGMLDGRGAETIDPKLAETLVALLPDNTFAIMHCHSADIHSGKLH